MKSIFRTLTAIIFSLLLVMMPSVAVFADDDSAPNNIPADAQELEKGSDIQRLGSNMPDNQDNDNDDDEIDDDMGGEDDDDIDDDLDDENDDNDIDNDMDDDDNDEIDTNSDGDDMNNEGDDEGLSNEGDDNPSDPAPVVSPVTVSITDFGNTYLYETESDGTVRIAGLFHTFEPGAYGYESFVMIVGGRAYPITISSTGKVYGRLPRGFSIKNGELAIKGVASDMDIYFVDHTMVSGMHETPDGDDSYYEPTDSDNETQRELPVVTPTASTNTSRSVSNTDSVSVIAPVEKKAETKTVEVISPANDSTETEQVLDAYEDEKEDEGKTLPLATGIALSIGAVSGLGVLLKLKLFAAL